MLCELRTRVQFLTVMALTIAWAYLLASRPAKAEDPILVTTDKPSQALSLDISHLPITRFVYETAIGAYHPAEFKPPDKAKVVAAEDDPRSGFQGLAVEYRNGTQKIAVLAIAGTDPSSIEDMRADIQLGFELRINSKEPVLANAGIEVGRTIKGYWLDGQIDKSIAFYQKVRALTDAPIVGTGHSLGGTLVNVLSGKFGIPGITFAAPPIPLTVLDRHSVKRAGFPNSIHFVRPTDPIAQSWPHVPDAEGRKISLSPFPANPYLIDPFLHVPVGIDNPVYILAQHRLEFMKNSVTAHPEYAPFVGARQSSSEAQIERSSISPPVTAHDDARTPDPSRKNAAPKAVSGSGLDLDFPNKRDETADQPVQGPNNDVHPASSNSPDADRVEDKEDNRTPPENNGTKGDKSGSR